MKNKRLIYQRSGLLVILCLLMTVNSNAQTNSNFTGSWAYNESKSKLAEGGFRMVSQKLTITQTEKSFTLERTYAGQDGEERKTTETYTLDGKESVNPFFNTAKKSTATWSADKKSLSVSSVMVFERDGEKTEIKTVEVFKLTDADKTLSVDSQSSSSMGERKATLVYDKK